MAEPLISDLALRTRISILIKANTPVLQHSGKMSSEEQEIYDLTSRNGLSVLVQAAKLFCCDRVDIQGTRLEYYPIILACLLWG